MAAITYADIIKTLNPDQSTADIIDALSLASPIIKTAHVFEGNMPNGNQTTRFLAKPTATKRSYNEGVAKSKTPTTQVVDLCSQYEFNVEIDLRLLEKQPDQAKYMAGQEKMQCQSIHEDLDTTFFYGNSKTNIKDFDGIATRFASLSTTKGAEGYQVVSAGGAGSDNTSMYLVGWGQGGSGLFYPVGSSAGISRIVKPQERVTDANLNPYYAYCVNGNMQVGLSIENYRQIVRVANIDASDLITFGSASDTSPELIGIAARAVERLQNKDAGLTYKWYVSELAYGWLKTMVQNKANVWLTQREAQDGLRTLYIDGIEVLMSDQIINTEAKVS